MKKIFFTLILGGLFFMTCRKQTERDYLEYNAKTEHCSNGYQDADELSADCGGADCDSCIQVETPCELPENKVRFYEGPFLQTFVLYNQSISQSEGLWIFSASIDESDLEYFEIKFKGKPSVIQVYHAVTDFSFPESDEVFIQYHGYDSSDKYAKGEVYVNFIDGAYIITSCDAQFSSWGGTSLDDQWLNISF